MSIIQQPQPAAAPNETGPSLPRVVGFCGRKSEFTFWLHHVLGNPGLTEDDASDIARKVQDGDPAWRAITRSPEPILGLVAVADSYLVFCSDRIERLPRGYSEQTVAGRITSFTSNCATVDGALLEIAARQILPTLGSAENLLAMGLYAASRRKFVGRSFSYSEPTQGRRCC